MTRDHAIDTLRADMDTARRLADRLHEAPIKAAAIQALGRMHQALVLYFGPIPISNATPEQEKLLREYAQSIVDEFEGTPK